MRPRKPKTILAPVNSSFFSKDSLEFDTDTVILIGKIARNAHAPTSSGLGARKESKTTAE
jgi:hypothetical protein